MCWFLFFFFFEVGSKEVRRVVVWCESGVIAVLWLSPPAGGGGSRHVKVLRLVKREILEGPRRCGMG